MDEPRDGWDERYCTREHYDYMVGRAPEGAILANLWAHAPHNSHGPPFWYADEWLDCYECGAEFKNTAEQKRYWYETLQIPIHVRFDRCPTCRRARREAREEQRSRSQGKRPDAEPGAAADGGA